MKHEPALRYALWKAYKKKCVYTDNIIENLDDLYIDHIIPISSSEEEVQRKIILYNLDPNFDVKKSIENLVPCLRFPNRRKGDKPFIERLELLYLEYANGHKVKVEQEKTRLLSSFEKNLKTTLEAHQRELLPPIKDASFKKYQKTIIDERLHSTYSYVNSDSEVMINAFIPSIYDEIGSCIIQFFNAESGIAELYHDQILKLISKLDTGGIEAVLPERKISNDSFFFVSLGTTHFYPSENAFMQLRTCLEHFLIEYKTFYEKFLAYLEIDEFKITEDKHYCILRRAYRSEWKKLMEYSWAHDLDKGNGPEYCFNRNRAQIICLDKEHGNIKFWLVPTHVSEINFRSFMYPDDDMEILWRLPSADDRHRIESGGVWTAKRTLEWINEILATREAVAIQDNRYINPIFKSFKKRWFWS